MASKHILKNTETEAVVKLYITTQGGVVDVSLLNDLTKDTQVYVAPTSIPDETGGEFVEYTGSRVYITGLWWGLKDGKQLDISRILNPVGPVLHNHYYLIGSNHFDYNDFADRIYANKDIRATFDGEGFVILRLRKEGWANKIETAEFGIYDDVTQVGS